MVILYLTCSDDKEADKISHALLNKKLIACARKWPVGSAYWWRDKINHDSEIMLMMESNKENFEKIDSVIAKIHSYQQYVLSMIDVDKTTTSTQKWLDESLRRIA